MKTDWQTTAIEIQQGGVNQSWEDFTADRGIIFNPLTPRSNFNSPHYQPYNSYNISSENLVLDQLIIPKLIFFFSLITYLVDIVLI